MQTPRLACGQTAVNFSRLRDWSQSRHANALALLFLYGPSTCLLTISICFYKRHPSSFCTLSHSPSPGERRHQ